MDERREETQKEIWEDLCKRDDDYRKILTYTTEHMTDVDPLRGPVFSTKEIMVMWAVVILSAIAICWLL